MEKYGMSDSEQRNLLIDNYVNLQRIKTAHSPEDELDYQIRTTKAKLEAMGVVTEDLLMD